MSTLYTGNPAATQAPAPAPGIGAIPIFSLPVSADGLDPTSIYQALKCTADYLTYLNQQPKSLFTDGLDGDATLDGTNTVSWASKVGNVYTMTRDAFPRNLTMTNAGVILKTANWRLLGSGLCTTVGGAVIQNDGPAGSGGNGGVAIAAGSLGVGSNGGSNLATNNPGGNGTNLTAVIGARGGSGGTAGANGGGAAGTITAPAASAGSVHVLNPQTAGFIFSTTATWLQINGGSGGGAGGDASVTGSAGGGGAGGGIMVVMFRQFNLANASDIHCAGGAGANAVAGGGTGSGGGGGGGGGVLILAAGNINQTLSAAVNCAGGAGGLHAGTAADGVAGSNGTLLLFSLA